MKNVDVMEINVFFKISIFSRKILVVLIPNSTDALEACTLDHVRFLQSFL